MSYTIDRVFQSGDFNGVVARTRTALAGEGFGILTEIDVKATMKKKLDADLDDYLILGACNPKMAHEAMRLEPRVGAMLPCNVIVRRTAPGTIEVSAVDPVASMASIPNEPLGAVARTVKEKLGKVIASI